MRLGVVSSHPSDVVYNPRAFLRLRDAIGPARTVGHGHDDLYARSSRSLREVGYDDVVSIEHEDLYMSARDGLTKAVELLRPLVPST